eukprot:TRINITY_DN1981_c0_g1_i1.p1 TRINITY_DN1981_c0_g1~~TRINITY_DN1981_c0_g1_i1.p1  ORF type:complete len:635 (-),score=198.91 TRINITY_DN1981_c0_g1_i1:6-1706(-)
MKVFGTQLLHYADKIEDQTKSTESLSSSQNVSQDVTPRDTESSDQTDSTDKPQLLRKESMLELKELNTDTPEMQKKRTYIIQEIISTETEYVKDLGFLINVYLEPIRSKHVLDDKAIKDIFGEVEQIHRANIQFEIDLKDKIEHQGRISISFSSLCEYLRIYGRHFQETSDYLKALKSVQENELLIPILKDGEKHPDSHFLTIEDFLIKPYQRMCKYPLLLQNLLESMPTSDPDYAGLKDSLEKLRSYIRGINEAKRESENTEKLFSIQDRFDSTEKFKFVQSGISRRYVMEGILGLCPGTLKDFIDQSIKPKDRQIFLLSDAIVIASNQKKNLHVKDVIFFENVHHFKPSLDNPILDLAFEISMDGGGNFLFFATSADEKARWVKAIKPFADIKKANLQAQQRAKPLPAEPPKTPEVKSPETNSQGREKPALPKKKTPATPPSPGNPGNSKETLRKGSKEVPAGKSTWTEKQLSDLDAQADGAEVYLQIKLDTLKLKTKVKNTMSCSSIVKNIMKKLPEEKLGKEYGLYIPDEVNQFMDPGHKLYAYSKFFDPEKTILELREKPK